MVMRVLVACEYSGRVRDAFIKKGHDAISCDLLPTESPGPHIEGDVMPLLKEKWDLIIAHPPCTYLTNTGSRWLHSDPTRWEKLDNGAAFFKMFLDADCEKIAVENPIMHRYAIERIGGKKQTQVIQPYMFGLPESKATCLWLKGLPKLKETNNVKHIWKKLPKSEGQKTFYLGPSKERAKLRSLTFQCIADAMADQWG